MALTARLGDAVVSVYSSFVNVTRQRSIDCTFRDLEGNLVHAATEYSNPTWDADRLRIWRDVNGREETICEVDTRLDPVPEGLETIVGLRRIVAESVRFTHARQQPSVPFAGIEESVRLQRLLNEIEETTERTGSARYFPGSRQTITTTDMERLG